MAVPIHIFVTGEEPPAATWNLNGAAITELRTADAALSAAIATKAPLSHTHEGEGAVPTIEVVSVDSYGAVGDGVTNDYAAVKAAYAAVTDGSTLYFSPGSVYRVSNYLGDGTGTANADFTLTESGIRIIGYGATLLMEPSGTIDRVSASTVAPVRPLSLIGCDGVTIEGLTIDGSGTSWTNTTNQSETVQGHGIYTHTCKNVTLRDVTVTKCLTDGLYIGASTTNADRHVRAERCRFDGNGRNGTSAIGANGVTYADCSADDNGLITGYGGHLPKAGFAIEPNVFTPTTDVDTGNVLYENCTAAGNVGEAFYGMPGMFDGSGPRLGAYLQDRVLSLKFAANGSAYQYIDLRLPDGKAFWGVMQMTVSGSYQGSVNTTGVIEKRLVLALQGDGSEVLNASEVTAAGGDLPDYFSSAPIWDGTRWNLRFYLRQFTASVTQFTVALRVVCAEKSALGVLSLATLRPAATTGDQPDPESVPASGTFTTVDGKTVTVADGRITGIV